MTTKSILNLAVPALVGAFALSTQAQVTIDHFTSVPTGFDNWDSATHGAGLTIRRASGSVVEIKDNVDIWGMASYIYDTPLDISFFGGLYPTEPNDQIAISARKLAPNASDLAFGMVDNDGTLAVWTVPAASFGTTLTQVKVDISSASIYGGTTAGFDKTKVTELQLWRNWDNANWGLYTGSTPSAPAGFTTTAPYQWQFDSFTAVPEPHEYAMFAGLGLIGFAAYRRYSVKAA